MEANHTIRALSNLGRSRLNTDIYIYRGVGTGGGGGYRTPPFKNMGGG